MGGLIGGPPPTAFTLYMAPLRFLEGIPSMVTEVCAQNILLRVFPLEELTSACVLVEERTRKRARPPQDCRYILP